MHNEKQLEWYREGLYSLMTGSIYGFVSTLVGHPFDTIKTKLQAQTEFMYEANLFTTIRDVWVKEGIPGFYKGAIPPFIGSILFRSLQFSIYDAKYAFYKDYEFMKKEIPGTFGLQYRVVAAGVMASSVRAIIESPFEYAKVKRQTGQSWSLIAAYKGFGTLYFRTVGMLTSFFIFMDTFRRKSSLFGTKTGQFLIAGVAASLAWIVIWPLENMKNIIQAESKNVGNTWMEKFHWIIKNHGFLGLYRGMLPGVAGVFFRNGASMVVMQFATRKMAEYNIRK
jgi:solute carrier family 25 carnitine/acylcarnitine transporter 20/29